MAPLQQDRFVRLPTEVLEALLHEHLNGGQWRIIFWVIRKTYGWNRSGAPFTWYKIAKDVGMSRPAIYRAGRALLANGVLVAQQGQLAIRCESVASEQRPTQALNVAGEASLSLLGGNGCVARRQRNTLLQGNGFPSSERQ